MLNILMSLTLIFSYFHFNTRFDDDVIDKDCEGNDNNNDRINIASLSLSQGEVISKCKFSDADLITPTNGLDCSIIEDTFDSITPVSYTHLTLPTTSRV